MVSFRVSVRVRVSARVRNRVRIRLNVGSRELLAGLGTVFWVRL